MKGGDKVRIRIDAESQYWGAKAKQHQRERKILTLVQDTFRPFGTTAPISWYFKEAGGTEGYPLFERHLELVKSAKTLKSWSINK